LLAIGKSAWSAKESKYIGVHCPLAITQGRISESLLSSCREAKKDLPNKKIDRMLDIDCFYTSWNWNVDVLLCHASVCFFWGNNFLNQWICPQVAIFFSQDMKVLDELSASALQATAGGSSVEVPYPWYMIYAYIYICTIFNGNFRILKWRYVSTTFLAIFCGDIPLLRPYIGLIW